MPSPAAGLAGTAARGVSTTGPHQRPGHAAAGRNPSVGAYLQPVHHNQRPNVSVQADRILKLADGGGLTLWPLGAREARGLRSFAISCGQLSLCGFIFAGSTKEHAQQQHKVLARRRRKERVSERCLWYTEQWVLWGCEHGGEMQALKRGFRERGRLHSLCCLLTQPDTYRTVHNTAKATRTASARKQPRNSPPQRRSRFEPVALQAGYDAPPPGLVAASVVRSAATGGRCMRDLHPAESSSSAAANVARRSTVQQWGAGGCYNILHAVQPRQGPQQARCREQHRRSLLRDPRDLIPSPGIVAPARQEPDLGPADVNGKACRALCVQAGVQLLQRGSGPTAGRWGGVISCGCCVWVSRDSTADWLVVAHMTHPRRSREAAATRASRPQT